MAFGDPYTFEELAHTLRTTAPAQLTLSAGQLLDLIEGQVKADQEAYDRGYDIGFQQGADAFEDAHECVPPEAAKTQAQASLARLRKLRGSA